MSNQLQVNVTSEIGKLNGVILHTPGRELQNMTPETAQRALYSDILNLTVAQEEYTQLKGVLQKTATTYEVSDLLKDVLKSDKVRFDIINRVCTNENAIDIRDYLLGLSSDELGRQLIEGVVMQKDSLTKFLSKDKYSLQPLHNFFFTRDSSIAVRDRVLIGRMANKVRMRESLIMETIFNNHLGFSTHTVNPINGSLPLDELSVEGGDVLIARKDIMLIGSSSRTSTQGIDFIINRLKDRKLKRDLIVQELPASPESFIHLDMVFTLLDKDTCMVYEPLIMKPNKFQTIHVRIDNGKVQSIERVENIPSVLKTLGMDLKPVICGGTKDSWTQEREQWHSGANFFAFGPGKVIGYGRNVYTMEEMNKAGFDVLSAKDIIEGKEKLEEHKKCVVCIEGSELARGGGGARCMTMPVSREEVKW
jgi:arginine deiminase